jgi:hypothetical protein
MFTSYGYSWAYICYNSTDEDNNKSKNIKKAIMVYVVLPYLITLDAGQYDNLWIPPVGLFL